MWQGRGKTAIVGIGYSDITRRPQKPLGLLAVDACRAAITDAGLEPRQIDGLTTYPESPFAGAGSRDGEDVVSVIWIINHLPLAPDIRWYAQIETGMIASPIIEAIHAIMAGACDYVLVWRALHRPGPRGPARRAAAARPRRRRRAVHGALRRKSIIQWHALAWQRYMHRYGATREALAALALNSRRNANLNPRAFFYNQPMSRDDYFNSRWIAEPMCLFDCDVPVDGCVAIILTRAERACDLRQSARLYRRLRAEYGAGARYSITRSTITWPAAARSRISFGRRRDSVRTTWMPRNSMTASILRRYTGSKRRAFARKAKARRSSKTDESRWKVSCRSIHSAAASAKAGCMGWGISRRRCAR